MYRGEDLSDVLRRFDESDFSISQFEGLRMDGSDQFGDEAETEARQQMMNSTTSSTYSMNSIILEEDRSGFGDGNKGTASDHHGTSSSFRSTNMEMGGKRNKKKTSGSVPASQGSRRKGAPHRAPFS